MRFGGLAGSKHEGAGRPFATCEDRYRDTGSQYVKEYMYEITIYKNASRYRQQKWRETKGYRENDILHQTPIPNTLPTNQ